MVDTPINEKPIPTSELFAREPEQLVTEPRNVERMVIELRAQRSRLAAAAAAGAKRGITAKKKKPPPKPSFLDEVA